MAPEQFDYNQEYFDRIQDWNRVSFPWIAPLIAEALKVYRPGAVLDYGCGAGVYARELARQGAAVDGCDISDTALEKCRTLYRETWSVLAPPRQAAYDLIFSTEVLEHIDDYRAALRSMYGLLRPGGVVLLTTTTYAISIYSVFQAVREKKLPLSRLGREVWAFLRGFSNEKRRDQFVVQYCFQRTGGHLHGFLRPALAEEFAAVGFEIPQAGVFYAYEAIQLPSLHTIGTWACLGRQEWSWGRRIGQFMLHLILKPLNGLLKQLGWAANNLYIVARKPQGAT